MKKMLIGLIAFLLLLPSLSVAELSFDPIVEKNEDGEYTINGTGVYVISGDGTETEGSLYLINDSDSKTDKLTVTLRDVSVERCYAEGNVEIILEGENTFRQGLEYESVEIGLDALPSWLIITGEGALTAVGWSDEENQWGSHGIDLGYRSAGLRINGGKITAIGGLGGAGIGGHYAHIVINDGTIQAKGGYGGAGIGGESIAENNSDRIEIEINGGKIVAEGGYGGAGIGAGMLEEGAEPGSQSITIRGGTICATGDEGGNGIGGFDGDIIIEGGIIESAVGGIGAAGIGGAGMCVAIRGGEILSAVGGEGAAGIGGNAQESGNVYISGGKVTVLGGEDGAGIGGGKDGNAIVKITNGIINASSSSVAIGGGEGGNGSVTITNGTVNASGGWAGIGGYDIGDVDGYVSNVTIIGGRVSASGSYGIDGNTIIYGGEIEASGSTSGISGSVIMEGGRLAATGSWECGIDAGGWGGNGLVLISGGDVYAQGKSDYGGIVATNIEIHGGIIGRSEDMETDDISTSINGQHITITGGTIYAVSNSPYNCVAIGSVVGNDDGCDLRISGGTIHVRSEGLAGIGMAEWSGAEIRIDGGEIYVDETKCIGVYGNRIIIDGGIIHAHVEGDYGIYGDDVTISDGTIDVVGRNGIGGQKVHISGGEISAVGLGGELEHLRKEEDEIESGLVIDSENLTLDGGRINGQSYDV